VRQFSGDESSTILFGEKRTDMRAIEYIRNLAVSGVYHFTTSDAIVALGGNPPAVRAQLRRLKQQKLIAEPVRSFHVIVPPEDRRLGCLPAEHFIDQLMRNWDEPYYVCLLSAAERHGAAHQRPQKTQVMVRKNRQRIECGMIRIEFIARGDLDRMPVTHFNTPRGVLKYSSPETTALELVGYPAHAGGLSNIATVLSELSGEMVPDKLLEAAKLCPVSWSQRIGHLLELIGKESLAGALEPFVRKNARSYTPLRRTANTGGANRSPRWKLIINVEVEPDV